MFSASWRICFNRGRLRTNKEHITFCSMSTHPFASLLPAGHRKARPVLRLMDGLGLVRGRVHEFCGPSRRTLALIAARATDGPVLWLSQAWASERLNPEGIQPFMEPGRLSLITARRTEDILWAAEEALRSGAVPVVVADLPEAPALTPVRRLHLAAEAGTGEGRGAPVGVLLTPGDGGAPGIETRWHMTPSHGPAESNWVLSLRRSRDHAPTEWLLNRANRPEGLHFTLARAGEPPRMDEPSLPVMEQEA
jgi:protein ImuA